MTTYLPAALALFMAALLVWVLIRDGRRQDALLDRLDAMADRFMARNLGEYKAMQERPKPKVQQPHEATGEPPFERIDAPEYELPAVGVYPEAVESARKLMKG